MVIEAHLLPWKAIERIGIVPLTSRFPYGENDRRVSDDFRRYRRDEQGVLTETWRYQWMPPT